MNATETAERRGRGNFGNHEQHVSAGRKGGEATAEKGRAFYQEIGRKGGEATAERHGEQHFSEIGRKGGER